jgi:hypothetical protein
MWSWRPVVFALLSGAAVIHPAAGNADQPSGTAVAVLQAAEASGAVSGRRILQLQGPVYMGDRIDTGAVGEAQLQFRDDTRLVVGPNSQLVIDKFVFNEQSTAKDVSINAVRGAFRFITGGSPKQAYSLRTPTATIGVRGTKFDFSVGPDGGTNFVLYEGSAKLCDLSGHCIVLKGGCSIAVLQPHRAAQLIDSVAARANVLKAGFPYLLRQNRLRSDFRIDTSSCLVRRVETVPKHPSLDRGFASASPLFHAGGDSGILGDDGNSGGGGVAAGGGDSSGGKCGGSCGIGNNGNGTGNEGNGRGPGNGNGNGGQGNGSGNGNHGKP